MAAVAPMVENMFIDEIETRRLVFNCGIPSLKMLGEFSTKFNIFFPILNKTRNVSFPEIVITSVSIYFGVALVFYYQI